MSEEISKEEIAALLAMGSDEMPREKAKVKTFDILRFVADNAGLSMFAAIEKAYYMGLSEQESVLDKIRAEIEQIADEEQKHDEKWAIGLRYAVKIIDKYKAESEG